LDLSSGGGILNVEQIRFLTDQEIAEGLREAAGFPAPPAAIGGFSLPVDGALTPPAAAPSDPLALPDVVGQGRAADRIQPYAGASGQLGLAGSRGEVESDLYESPAISEIGPEF
ncbi:MAG: hypothetical protein LBV15_04355, partial [Planctomycetota bacterium]|nr:hypothetical protein [Planctomycetota bacterium]